MLLAGVAPMVALGSLVALVVMVVGLTAHRECRFDRVAYFLFVVAATVTAAPVLSAFTSAHLVFDERYGDITVSKNSAASTVAAYSAIALLALAFLMVTLSARMRQLVNVPAVCASCVWLCGVVSNYLNGAGGLTPALAATGAVLCCCILVRPTHRGPLGPAVFGILLCALSGIAVWVNPAVSTAACRVDKCGPLGSLVYGVLGNENALGLAAALTIPFVYFAFEGRIGAAMITYLCFMVWITGSRSALFAAIATVAVLLVCRPTTSGSGRRRTFAVSVLVGGLLASVLIPASASAAASFSGRGQVWSTAYAEIDLAPIVGHGADGWTRLRALGEISAAASYSAHNMWLDVLFVSGMIGLAMFLLTFVALFHVHGFWRMAPVSVCTIFMGISERPLTFTAVNWLVWLVPALLIGLGGFRSSWNRPGMYLTNRCEGVGWLVAPRAGRV